MRLVRQFTLKRALQLTTVICLVLVAVATWRSKEVLFFSSSKTGERNPESKGIRVGQRINLQSITHKELTEIRGDPQWLILDVRDSNAFNGWIAGEEQRGGHIPGAMNLPLGWMTNHQAAALRLIALQNPKARKLVLYGDSASMARQMGDLLHATAEIPGEQMFVFEESIAAWSRDPALPMDRLPLYEKLVPVRWVHRLIHEGDAQMFRIIDVAWRNRKQYEGGHIPGALYLDTDEIESAPMWNIAPADQLQRVLLSLGITKHTQVIVYGRDSTAAARAAVVMMYAGVDDVRLLNGGFQAWRNAGLEVETGDVQTQPATDFGARIPAHPDWIVGIDQAKQVLASPNGRLVSIRSWPEYIGQTSGYAYIAPKGRIAGAVWGHAGSDRNHMEHYRNPDNTLRDYHEIAASWRDWDIHPDNQICFYCGTGWRASEAFFAAYLMGYENISVFDGGWLEWSADASNPVVLGPPDGAK